MNIVFTSFGGRYSDSPRALYEALVAAGRADGVRWLVDPRHADGFPADVRAGRAVPATGVEARVALEAADMVVSNTHIDLDWDKRPGAFYLQTWHGTPLKHIHFDSIWDPTGRVAELTVDVRRWDALLSPNAASTPRLRKAFGFTGDLAETGYPRNDVLTSPHRHSIRARVRRDLGIAEDAPVVLYTPTYRDTHQTATGEQDFALHLDLADFTARLPGHQLLLRLHYMLSDKLGPVDAPGVHDVSFHPDVSELYLAADAMVTDYSSTMFDFAVTGKPLVFFTYDLEHYRDQTRGFYFDPVPDAPGPHVRTSAEVVDALAGLHGVQQRYATAYQRFRDTYCSLEDGHSTDRVLDRFLSGCP